MTTHTVHLIGMGSVPAKPAQDLKVGDLVVYNYGETAKIFTLEILKSGWVRYQVRSKSGQTYSRKKRFDTLVAWRQT